MLVFIFKTRDSEWSCLEFSLSTPAFYRDPGRQHVCVVSLQELERAEMCETLALLVLYLDCLALMKGGLPVKDTGVMKFYLAGICSLFKIGPQNKQARDVMGRLLTLRTYSTEEPCLHGILHFSFYWIRPSARSSKSLLQSRMQGIEVGHSAPALSRTGVWLLYASIFISVK